MPNWLLSSSLMSGHRIDSTFSFSKHLPFLENASNNAEYIVANDEFPGHDFQDLSQFLLFCDFCFLFDFPRNCWLSLSPLCLSQVTHRSAHMTIMVKLSSKHRLNSLCNACVMNSKDCVKVDNENFDRSNHINGKSTNSGREKNARIFLYRRKFSEVLMVTGSKRMFLFHCFYMNINMLRLFANKSRNKSTHAQRAIKLVSAGYSYVVWNNNED